MIDGPPTASISASETVQIVTLVIGFLGTVLTAAMAYLMAKLNIKAKAASDAAALAAAKVEEVKKAAIEVKKTLVETNEAVGVKLDSIVKTGEATQKTGEAIHTLVNSQFGEQLKLSAETSRFKARVLRERGDSEAAMLAEKAADLAEKILMEHMAKQQIVDDQCRQLKSE